MEKFVLTDAYCASHVGNDVPLESSIRLFKKNGPDVEIKVHTNTKNAFEGSQNITCGHRLFANLHYRCHHKALMNNPSKGPHSHICASSIGSKAK